MVGLVRVLVVDDEPVWRLLLRNVLEGCGHQVEEANDGRAALEVVRSADPDLVITDLNMAGMGGRELLARIRSDPITARTPVIIMSARVPAGLHADAVLPKPVSLSRLTDTIGAVLSRAKRERPAHLERNSGLIAAPRSGGVSDHACWAYSSDAERASCAASWLTDGMRLGQRCLYVAAGSREELLDELAGIPDRTAAVDRGALLVAPSSEVYDLSAPIDAVSQLRMYAAAVDEAIDQGYRGLRVAGDMSPLLADRSRHPTHLHWEQVADRYMTSHPLAPLCMYDAREIRDIDAVVCAHPLQGPPAGRFALYGVAPDAAALRGEVDLQGVEAFGDLLARLPSTDRVIDLAQLSFIDGHSAWVLHDELETRRSAGQAIVLTSAPEVTRQLWDICGFDRSFLVA